ncbi:hypothetical protein EB796_006973 [Bugula neritina]|uniref:Uncharacterized protein n=1 Tax=Bugula neritina TaxID=10212 RepID=A0A7J7K9U3_BUGNE|nr:hypothetical protein EB796_006973 [Bugula neritina]
MVPDQRFPVDFPRVSLNEEDRFLLIVKNQFPKKLRAKVLQSQVKGPYRSLSLSNSTDNFEKVKWELNELREAFVERKHPLPSITARTEITSSQSEKEHRRKADDSINIATTAYDKSLTSDGPDTINDIQRQKTFYPDGWPKTKNHLKELNNTKLCFISNNELREAKQSDTLDLRDHTKQKKRIKHGPGVAAKVSDNHYKKLKPSMSNLHFLRNENVGSESNYYQIPNYKHSNLKSTSEFSDSEEYASEGEGGAPTLTDTDLSEYEYDTIGDSRHESKVATQLPALVAKNKHETTTSKHTKQTKGNGRQRLKLPKIKRSKRLNANEVTSEDEKLQRKPVISSMVQLKDLVSHKREKEQSRVVDPYSVYLKYKGHMQVIDNSIYNRHARKGGGR